MPYKRVCIGLSLLLLLFLGCQTVQAPREKDQQANAYIEQAQAYESQGNLVEALEKYKLAQTVDPAQPQVNDSISRLEAQLEKLAETHYQAGLRFRDKGKWTLAKREFLKALRYSPEHEGAAAMLQGRTPSDDGKYIIHTIGPGESLSKLAMKYYGDYRKYHHIANFNNMTDAKQVKIGQKIMIPVIEGVSFADLNRISSGRAPQATGIEGEYVVHQIAPGESLSKVARLYYGDYKLFNVIAKFNGITDPTGIRVGQKIKVPRREGMTAYQQRSTATGDEEPSYIPEPEETKPVVTQPEPTAPPEDEIPPETVKPSDQVAEYRETGIALFNENAFDDAIVELKKVLNATPDDPAAISYISRAYMETGRQHLDAGRLNKAKSALTAALGYDANCKTCQDLLEQCRTAEADTLKAEGESFYENNQFDSAITTFNRALALDPENSEIRQLLFQSHFQKALILYNNQDYLAAKTDFEKAAVINPDCEECRQYIGNSVEAYKEFHYNEGIVFFGKQELREAIGAWEKVVAVDPDYKDASQNLKKAQLLNKRLELIKKGSE
ncbi:tetratricopeptide repeat protein [Desulfosarcina ovata]|uniref:LysM domain-containing protein n=1 Tax=Desulfosarcina ovata subsp. ovata TaxID=2752305 RepID=A0A5K8A7A5_9BACT|nr:tetratricopeptide repeat protein [Desulfosarcina ovata]BBO88397.1 hypothetical protein DSCOOX_15770 [Desulfosarcina ovata subsp. ovata]